MIVKLRKRSSRYRDLTPGQPYVVIGIEGNDFRFLNDAGRRYLHPPRLFDIFDPREPGDWVTEYGGDGERYASHGRVQQPLVFAQLSRNRGLRKLPDGVSRGAGVGPERIG
jgi:hypothetical protein